jgi:hypothetical protein
MTTTARTDTWLNTVTIDGSSIGTWDTLKGGDNDSTVTNYRPGGMVALKVVRAKVGKSSAVVSRQLLDVDGNPYGSPLIYSGILKQVMPGDTDSMKGDPQIWSIVIVPGGQIG